MRAHLTWATAALARFVTFVLVLSASCTEPEARTPAAEAPARRQLDSMVARSRLPGAPAVGRALDVLGQTEVRAAAHDTIH